MNEFKTPKGTTLPLMDFRGKKYLQVAHRLVWFREEHPDWRIETSAVLLEEKKSVFRATISNPSGAVLAMAHKSETVQGFADHMEKAETGAIGRALALCGYGTQFCADELDEGERLSDAPLGKPNPWAMKNVMRGENDGVPDDRYRVKFGKKHVGKTLDQIPVPELISFIQWCEDEEAKKGKPVSIHAPEFLKNAKQYLEVAAEQDQGD